MVGLTARGWTWDMATTVAKDHDRGALTTYGTSSSSTTQV